MYAWLRTHRKAAPVRQAEAAEHSEVRRLQAELRRVTEERDILKKAAAYFAKQHG
jgi:transposase